MAPQKNLVSTTDYRDFRIEELDTWTTDADHKTVWRLSRIEGGFGETHRHQHGSYPSLQEAMAKADQIADADIR